MRILTEMSGSVDALLFRRSAMIPRKQVPFSVHSAPQPARGVVQKSREVKLQRSAAMMVSTSVGATFAPTNFFSPPETKASEGHLRFSATAGTRGVLKNQGGYST